MTASGQAVVVKLGGSVFSDKRRSDHHTDRSAMDRAVARLQDIRSQGLEVVLVSGGGSFGHGAIRRAESPGAPGRHPLLGLVRDLELVRAAWVDAFTVAGMDAISVALPVHDPEAAFRVQGLGALLDAGIVPVLSGGVRLDPDGRLSIVSSDRVPELVARIPGRRWTVLMVTDTPGLVDGRSGRTIPCVGARERGEVETLVRAAPEHDRTGGMRTKLDGLYASADAGASTALVSQDAFFSSSWPQPSVSLAGSFPLSTSFLPVGAEHERSA